MTPAPNSASAAPARSAAAGVVAGASNLGAAILRHTGHRVLSAPYHRNQGGMLTELHIGLSSPQQSEAFLRGAHVTLLAFCNDDAQTRDIAKAEPGGPTLAAGKNSTGYEFGAPASRFPRRGSRNTSRRRAGRRWR